jgi:hypothetical protein
MSKADEFPIDDIVNGDSVAALNCMPKPKKEPGPLEGWQQIAAYLGQPISVSQRWDKAGMPVAWVGGRFKKRPRHERNCSRGLFPLLLILRRRHPRTGAIPNVFITGHGDVPMSVRAMKAGAVEFRDHDNSREEAS